MVEVVDVVDVEKVEEVEEVEKKTMEMVVLPPHNIKGMVKVDVDVNIGGGELSWKMQLPLRRGDCECWFCYSSSLTAAYRLYWCTTDLSTIDWCQQDLDPACAQNS